MAKKSANRRGGDGCGLSKDSALHSNVNLPMDLEESANKWVVQAGLSAMPEVVVGIEPTWFAPGRGFVSSVEGAVVLYTAAKDPGRRVSHWRPAGQPDAKPKEHEPSGALQHFHSTLRADVLVALWIAAKEGLPSAMPLVRQLLTEAVAAIEREYQVEVLLGCVHPPSPFLEKALAKEGWCSAIGADEGKEGFWNLHLQIYVSRLKDHQWIPKEMGLHRPFTNTSDKTVSVMHLAELGVDVNAHAYSAKAALVRRRCELFFLKGATGCRPAQLTPEVVNKVMSGHLLPTVAIEGAAAHEIDRWRKAWAKPAEDKTAYSLAAKNRLEVGRLMAKRAPGLTFSRWFTEQMLTRLPGLDARYSDLLLEGRTAYREIKEEQIRGGHRELLNDLFNRWWKRRQEADVRKKEELHEREREDLQKQAAEAEALAYEARESLREMERTMAMIDVETQNEREVLESQILSLEKTVAAKEQRVSELSARMRQLEGRAQDVDALRRDLEQLRREGRPEDRKLIKQLEERSRQSEATAREAGVSVQVVLAPIQALAAEATRQLYAFGRGEVSTLNSPLLVVHHRHPGGIAIAEEWKRAIEHFASDDAVDEFRETLDNITRMVTVGVIEGPVRNRENNGPNRG